MPDETQQLVAGRYRLDRSLGAGGMGQVWLAEDALLGRAVAVKVVDLRGHADEEALRARVMREARAAARIDHHGSVRVFDVVDEGHAVYLVMELVHAPTLAEVVQRDGPLTPAAAARIGLDVLGALGAAHGAGIVHRDVKPNNVMVLPDGRAKLADFGIASVKDDPAITHTGMVLGTPKYMSPEQARGETVGAPADLWALGALLHFAVEGAPPFDRGEPLPTLNAVLHDAPPPPERAGPLRPVIEALLVKDPAARPAVAEVRHLLERAADAAPDATRTHVLPPPAPAPAPTPTVTPVTTARPAPVRRDRPPVDRADRRWLVALAVVGAIALVAAAALALTSGDDEAGTDDAAAPETTAEAPVATTTTTDAATTTTTAAPAPTATGDRPAGVPADWQRHETGQWALWHPLEWRPEGGPAGSTDFRHPSGDYLRIDTVGNPGDDPVAAWEEQEQRFRSTYPDYQRIRIEPTTYQGEDAAIWEYTYAGKRAANLGFAAGGRGFALNLVTAEGAWEEQAATWEGFLAGFELPGGGGDEDDEDD